MVSPFCNSQFEVLQRYWLRLVFSDAAMKQFLLHLDEKNLLGSKFIIQDLDETHLFISAEILEVLQSRIDELMDQISFPLTQRETDF